MIALIALACSAPPPTVVGIQEPPPPKKVAPHCPTPGEPMIRGALADADLDEVSGVAKSRIHDVFWVHNDSGDDPKVYAVGGNGADLGHFDLKGADAVDWEDMALVPGEEGDFLILADIGDNREKRDTVQLYRIAEPKPGTPGSVEAEKMVVEYPSGPRNAEVLLADPRDGHLYILTKSDEGVSALYALGAFREGRVQAEAVGTRRFPVGRSSAKATGGDISRDGKWVAIRTYTTAWLWPIEGELKAAFRSEPCEVRPPSEPQGEALTFVEGGLVTMSEGEHASVHFVPLTMPAPTPDP